MHVFALKMWGKITGDKNLEARYVWEGRLGSGSEVTNSVNL